MNISKLSNLILVIFILFLCSGCEKPSEQRSQSSNPSVQVEKLFTHDGCTVYRFYDRGRKHYFSKCDNSISQTISPKNCGKSCIRDEVISTF